MAFLHNRQHSISFFFLRKIDASRLLTLFDEKSQSHSRKLTPTEGSSVFHEKTKTKTSLIPISFTPKRTEGVGEN